MAQVMHHLQSQTRGLATSSELTTEEIQERHMKRIAEISKHLTTEPIQAQDLNYEQKQWLYFRMSRPFPKPYSPWPKTKKEFKTFNFAGFGVSRAIKGD